ncbi:hypothetical protein V493_07598, partial [Pseudogymnoascus sp. VKM F-4281 (FW-2241)]
MHPRRSRNSSRLPAICMLTLDNGVIDSVSSPMIPKANGYRELTCPVPSEVEEPIALSVPPPSDPQQPRESTTGKVSKDGADPYIAAAVGDVGPS